MRPLDAASLAGNGGEGFENQPTAEVRLDGLSPLRQSTETLEVKLAQGVFGERDRPLVEAELRRRREGHEEHDIAELQERIAELERRLRNKDAELRSGQRWIRKIAGARGRTLGGQTPPTKPQHEKGFATETAEKTGMAKRTINQAFRRAERISPDVMEAIKGTPMADTGVELDALTQVDHDQQMAAVKRVKTGEVLTVREAINKDDSVRTSRPSKSANRSMRAPSLVEPEKLLYTMQNAWIDADENVRKRFRTWLENRGFKLIQLPARRGKKP